MKIDNRKKLDKKPHPLWDELDERLVPFIWISIGIGLLIHGFGISCVWYWAIPIAIFLAFLAIFFIKESRGEHEHMDVLSPDDDSAWQARIGL